MVTAVAKEPAQVVEVASVGGVEGVIHGDSGARRRVVEQFVERDIQNIAARQQHEGILRQNCPLENNFAGTALSMTSNNFNIDVGNSGADELLVLGHPVGLDPVAHHDPSHRDPLVVCLSGSTCAARPPHR